jgi:predicted RNase H-like HicB family nuclease
MATCVLTGYVEQDGDQYSAVCSELEVASCGDTVEEALDNLSEALEVYLNALEEVGTLNSVFQKKGIEL